MSVLATIFFGYARNGTGRTARDARDRSMERFVRLSVRVQVANDDDRASRMVRASLAHGTEEQITTDRGRWNHLRDREAHGHQSNLRRSWILRGVRPHRTADMAPRVSRQSPIRGGSCSLASMLGATTSSVASRPQEHPNILMVM